MKMPEGKSGRLRYIERAEPVIGRTSSKQVPIAAASGDPSRKVEPRLRADRCPRRAPGIRYAPALSTAHLHPFTLPSKLPQMGQS